MYENFRNLLQKNGVTPYKVSKETGVSQSTLSDWKRGVSTPKNDKLQKIADYFNVSVSYLLTGEEKTESETCYLNDEIKGIAQEIFENQEMRMLFDVAKSTQADKLFTYAKFLNEELKKNHSNKL